MSRKHRPTSSPRRQGQRPPVKVPWWNRPLVWVGGVLSALALGIAGTFGSGLGQKLLTTIFGGGSSSTSAPPPTSGHKYCAAVVAPSGFVLSSYCSGQHAEGSAFPLGFSPPAENTVPLITIYQDDSYRSAALTFYGTDGQCDDIGYKLRDTRPIDDHGGSWGGSSWQSYGSCRRITLYYGSGLTGKNSYTYRQDVQEAAQIGSGLDNHVESIWVRY